MPLCLSQILLTRGLVCVVAPFRLLCCPLRPDTRLKQEPKCRTGLSRAGCLHFYINCGCSVKSHHKSITSRFIVKQIKRLDQLCWLGRVLREHQLLNIPLEWVLYIFHQLRQPIRILECCSIQLQHINRVHLVNILSHFLKVLGVQLECLTSQVRRFGNELESLLIFLSFKVLTTLWSKDSSHN